MKTLVFTICARNYIGLSRVLGESLARHGPDVDFRIYVADGTAAEDRGDPAILSAPEALAPFIDPVEFANMAFMYNITEFCTALKAACFMHGFGDGYERCLYMDPDIFVTADVGLITRELDNGAAILLTPHLCLPSPGEGPRPDHGILATGVYNLGFLGLRRNEETTRFLAWWHRRLRNRAFNDHYHALYTDQRWMDFVPSLFRADAVKVWRHLGCNLAPWNYHERQVEPAGDGFTVRPRQPGHPAEGPVPLVFLHFSGFDFRRILDGRFDQLNLAGAPVHADLLPVYERYGAAIRALAGPVAHYLSAPYAFDRFADGAAVLPSHRRLFRVWRERHGDAADPFATGPGSFHEALRQRGLLGRDAAADLAADKASSRTVERPERLLTAARRVFRLLFRVLGRARFFFLVRSLNRLSHVEQHYDTFRLDDARIVARAAPTAAPAP